MAVRSLYTLEDVWNRGNDIFFTFNAYTKVNINRGTFLHNDYLNEFGGFTTKSDILPLLKDSYSNLIEINSYGYGPDARFGFAVEKMQYDRIRNGFDVQYNGYHFYSYSKKNGVQPIAPTNDNESVGVGEIEVIHDSNDLQVEVTPYIVGEIPDEDIVLYFIDGEDGLTLDFKGTEHTFDWLFSSPRLSAANFNLVNLDEDEQDELVIILPVGSGSGV